MKKIEFDEMIERLTTATEQQKLKWAIDSTDETVYYTSVNNCRIEVSTYYDASAVSNKASIELFNTSGDSFKKRVFSEKAKPDRYNQINDLYEVINDSYYRIKESESLILEGLRELTDEH